MGHDSSAGVERKLAARTATTSPPENSSSRLNGDRDYPLAIVVTSVEYVSGYRIRVSFADRYTRELDLEAQLWGEVFEPLRDVNLFRQVRFDPDSETVVWPNGADLAPEFLRWGEHLDENCPCGH